MLKLLYTIITEPLGLPLVYYEEWIVLALIEVLAHEKTYEYVGRLYGGHWIYGRESGSIIYWLVKPVVFIAVWAVAYGIIRLFDIMMAHKIISNIIVITLLLMVVAVHYIRKSKRNTNIWKRTHSC